MQNYFKFWWDCLNWTYLRWRGLEIMATLPFAVIGLLGVTGGIVGILKGGSLIYLFSVPIVLALLIAPYRLWKQQNDKVTKLTTKKLEVNVEEQPEDARGTLWWHIIVRNPSSIPIESCYGQLVSFEPNKSNKPYRGLRLPWSAWVTKEMERYTIPGNASGTLDFVVALPRYCSIVALSPEEGKRTFFNYEEPGTYVAEIQVGSEKENFLATKIKVRIVFAGESKLTIEKIGDNGHN